MTSEHTTVVLDLAPAGPGTPVTSGSVDGVSVTLDERYCANKKFVIPWTVSSTRTTETHVDFVFNDKPVASQKVPGGAQATWKYSQGD